MKKSKILERYSKLNLGSTAVKIIEGYLKDLERGKTYLITKNGHSFPCQLTHFYADALRFKVLSNPNPLKQNANFHTITYLSLSRGVKIEEISKKELPKYMGTATQHMAEALRKN